MKILYLAHLFPLPMDSGAKLHTYYYLTALAQKHDVHVVAYVRYDEEKRSIPEVGSICSKLTVVPLCRGRFRQFSDAMASLVSRTSFIVSRDFRQEMSEAVRSEVDDFKPDLVYIDHLQMAQFVDAKWRCKMVLDHHNVESMIIKRIAATSSNPLVRMYARVEWPKLLRYELEVCKNCDLVLTVTDEDKAILQNLAPEIRSIHSLPVGVDLDYFGTVHRDEHSNNVLSIATMFWPPNVDSMLYFYKDIFPLVLREVPDCRLTIAGQRPVPSIQALSADPRVAVTGYVDDVRTVARDCGVFIVPLLSGSGLRQKILNALAMGLPIVSTSIGAEGIEVVPGENVLIADTPQEFARAVVAVLRDPELATRLGESGRQLVRDKYSRESVCSRLLSILDQHFPQAT